MADIIKLLPDSVANQIAAGEVIQRPASAVKELLENAIDARAGHIQLIFKDAGKTLIQVVDNGSGMSAADAKLCFSRHATSKISHAEDLFHIRTMGFRGEALASVAAIARVELITRREEDQTGTEIIMEASRLLSQESCQAATGTSISVKQLFFNTPARRNFLKSEAVERAHILNEFYRAALAHPDISFDCYQDGELVYKLLKSNLAQRIAGIFGQAYKERLIPLGEKTEMIEILGYILKPAFARKKRGEQYFFVNQRFIRSPYLNHAVEQAFEELIPEDAYPSFFILLNTDPSSIDVNVHPTKTEIKFSDERYVYQVLKAAVKKSLGQYHITPSLDFERETAFDQAGPLPSVPPAPPGINLDPDYNPFSRSSGSYSGSPAHSGLSGRINPQQWEKLFTAGEKDIQHIIFPAKADTLPDDSSGSPAESAEVNESGSYVRKFMQLHQRYILATVKSGLIMIDQQRAHERILYEKFINMLSGSSGASQPLLFPSHVKLNEEEAGLLREMLPDLCNLGLSIEERSRGTFVITSVPSGMDPDEPMQAFVESLMEEVSKNQLGLADRMKENLARSLSRKMAIKRGKLMQDEEIQALVDALFACQSPWQSAAGKPIISMLSLDEISKRFL